MLEFLASTDELTDSEVKELLVEAGVDLEQFHVKAEKAISVLVNRRRLARAKDAIKDAHVVRTRPPSRGLSHNELVERIRQWAERMTGKGVPVPSFNYRQFRESSIEQVESILDEIEEAAQDAGLTLDDN